MDEEMIKRFIDACNDSKKITELMPPLPKGIRPRHIHILDSIVILRNRMDLVRVSDVSERLNVTMPSITLLVNDLEKKGCLIKQTSPEDKRAYSLVLTELGELYYRMYIKGYHGWLSERFDEVSEEDMKTTIRTIYKVYEVMKRCSPAIIEEDGSVRLLAE